jgi:acetyltransferase-like isoleucine patch superfamily enzyme
LIVVWPAALTAGFGRVKEVYSFWASLLALIPGVPGSYIRVAYAHLTLEACSLDSCIEFGSFFAHAQSRVGRDVYIGAYCVLGRAQIGDRTHLASGVQILSGGRQHPRAADGRLLPSDESAFETIHIGTDCWIGAGAIVMADVGERSTIGAGSVVTRPIPPDVVAVGSPARVRGDVPAV